MRGYITLGNQPDKFARPDLVLRDDPGCRCDQPRSVLGDGPEPRRRRIGQDGHPGDPELLEGGDITRAQRRVADERGRTRARSRAPRAARRR